MKTPAIGKRVKILGSRAGTVVGHGFRAEPDFDPKMAFRSAREWMEPVIIVHLDEGFYPDTTKDLYVSSVACHPDSLEIIT